MTLTDCGNINPSIALSLLNMNMGWLKFNNRLSEKVAKLLSTFFC